MLLFPPTVISSFDGGGIVRGPTAQIRGQIYSSILFPVIPNQMHPGNPHLMWILLQNLVADCLPEWKINMLSVMLFGSARHSLNASDEVELFAGGKFGLQ